MIDKLKFEPVEGHVVLDFVPHKSKLTPKIEIDIALRILEKQSTKDLETFFVPIYNGIIEFRAKEEQENKQEPP